MTAAVAWGVTSRGVSPVPPVVTMSGWFADPSTRAASIAHCSSGIRSRSTVKPRAARRSSTRAPEVSSRAPAAAPSLAVMTSAVRPAIRSWVPLIGGSRVALALRPHASCDPRARPRLGVLRGLRRWRLADPRAALAPGLGDEPDAPDLDAAFHALDHVIDRQGGDRRRGHAPPSRRPSARSWRPRRGCAGARPHGPG